MNRDNRHRFVSEARASGTRERRHRAGFQGRWLIALLLLAGWMSGCQKSPQEGVVLATVGQARLTERAVEARIPVQLMGKLTARQKRHLAEAWVNEELLYQEAKRLKLDKDPEVAARISQAVKDLLVAVLLDRETQKNADVFDADIRAYYEAHKKEFMREDTEIRARQILVRNAGELDMVQRRLRNGETFDQVARDMSIDASAEAGGDLGYFTRDMVDPAFWNACEKAPIGRRVKAVTPLGYHLIEVLDRHEAGTVKDLSEVSDEIRARILAERREKKRQALLAELRKRIPWSIQVKSGDAEEQAQEDPKTQTK